MSQQMLVEGSLAIVLVLAGMDFLRRLRHEMARVDRGIRLVHFFVDHGRIHNEGDAEPESSGRR